MSRAPRPDRGRRPGRRAHPRPRARPRAAPAARRRPRRCSRCRRRGRPRRPAAGRPCASARAAGRRPAPRSARRGPPGPARRASPTPAAASTTSASKPPACSREPGEVLLVVRGVGDRQEALGAEPVREEVVEHPAVVAAEHRVLGAALGELRHVVREQPLEKRLGAGPARLDLAHVRDVEHARAACARPRARGGSPSYCTGISQPANGTSLAPAGWWRSKRGVRRSVAAAEGKPRRGYRPPGRSAPYRDSRTGAIRRVWALLLPPLRRGTREVGRRGRAADRNAPMGECRPGQPGGRRAA